MKENNNALLTAFIKENALQHIADDGFSERVMQHLPDAPRPMSARLRWATRAWTAFCVVVAVVLFVVMQGWQVLSQGLSTALTQGLVTVLTYAEVLLRLLPTQFDLSTFIDYTTTVNQTSLLQLLASVFTLLVLSIVGLSHWVYQEEM